MSADGRYGLLFELSRDAVAEIEMIDGVPVVRRINPAFVDIFGYEPGAIVGESLNDFIVPERRTGEAATFDRRTAEGEANWATVSRKTADGIREFLYRGVPFERDGDSYGLAVYTDVTEQRRREQHHQVLHRVLRHNLRNGLTRILAAAEALAGADDGAVTERGREIRAAAEELQELSNTAGRVEEVLGSAATDRTTVDVAATLRGLVTRYREEQPECRLETDLPDRLDVAPDHRLAAALGALVENAVEHGAAGSRPAVGTGSTSATDGEDASAEERTPPFVEITARIDGREAVVSVTDDGPGIPECERAAIFDDRSLSQLSHGSGLGLWLAKWIVEGYGGRLTYERRG